MAMRGDAAGDEHDRQRRASPTQFVAQAHVARAGMAQVADERDFAAHRAIGGVRCGVVEARRAWRQRRAGMRGGVDEAHGGIQWTASWTDKAIERCGSRDANRDPRGARRRTIFRWTQRSPQDLAPTPSLARPSGCPGFKGPVPQPVSMDGAQLASGFPDCQSLHAHKAIDYLEPYFGRRPAVIAQRILLRSMTPRLPRLPCASAGLLAACCGPRRRSGRARRARHSRGRRADRDRDATSRRETPEDELDSLATWPPKTAPTWLIATGQVEPSPGRVRRRQRRAPAHGRRRGQRRAANSSVPTASPCTATTCSWSNATTTACRCWRCPISQSLGTFGEDELRSPYGLWLTETEPGELEVYVTDSFMDGKHFDVVPPLGRTRPARAPLSRRSRPSDGTLATPTTPARSATPATRPRCAWSNRSPAIRPTTAC